MTDHEPTPSAIPAASPSPAAPARRMQKPKAILAAGALGLLALGFAGGATAWSMSSREEARFDPALSPTPIADLSDASSVGIKGEVVEIYGNKFILGDGAARALVETGRAGEGGGLVAKGETLTVQGRFDDGFLRAEAIQHADQRIDELSPPPPPHRRDRDHGPDRGPRGGPGPDDAGEPGRG